MEVVQFLLDVGKAVVSAEDDAGNTAAALSARLGNLQCLELVVAKGASLDHANKRGSTPFGVAVLNGRMAIIDWLLKKPINFSHTDKDGNTPLHYAAACGYVRVVRQLLSAHVKTNIENANNEKAEDVASNDTIKAVIQAGDPHAHIAN